MTTIRTDSPLDVLALVPYRLGFHPAESVVAVSLRHDDTIGLVARMDIADLAAPASGGHAARSLLSHLVADGACGAVVVVYTGSPDLRTDGVRSTAARALITVLDAADELVDAVETWVVGPQGYYAVDCTDPDCCPAGGRPVSELQATQVSARMVLDGVGVAASRGDLARLPTVSGDARRSARKARDRWRGRGPGGPAGVRPGGAGASGGSGGARSGPVSAADAARWRAAGLELWRELTGRAGRAWDEAGDAVDPGRRGPCPWEPPGPAEAGRLLAALDDDLVRDAVLLSCVAGTERLADRVVAGDHGATIAAALRVIVDPVDGSRPDRPRVAAARAVLEHVAAHAPRPGHAPSLTLLGMLAWWEGEGARAAVLAQGALRAEPGLRLAELLEDVLADGVPPGWVRRLQGA